MSASDALMVFVTCPAAAAPELARRLVAARLAACVNILSGVQSVYRWQDEVVDDAESLLLIKTVASRYTALEQAVRQHHPYELPEVLAVAVEAGLPAYLRWMEESTQ